MASTWGNWLKKKLQTPDEPDSKKPNFVLSGPGAAQYSKATSELPANFHQLMMDAENKLKMASSDTVGEHIPRLMSLYSVSARNP